MSRSPHGTRHVELRFIELAKLSKTLVHDLSQLTRCTDAGTPGTSPLSQTDTLIEQL